MLDENRARKLRDPAEHAYPLRAHMSRPFDGRSDTLFVMQSQAYVRNFESVLTALAARGHPVTVLLEERKEGDESGLAVIDRLCREHRTLRYELRPSPPLGWRGGLRLVLEAMQDYLRYFDPPYADASRLRARAVAFLPAAIERALARAIRAWPRGRHALAAGARWISDALGADPRIRGELKHRQPAALIVTPMIHFRSRQREWVRAAAELRIGSMYCVHSWDNLTNRGLMHAHPDRVVVWNDIQQSQAITLHGASASSVEVTGAWPYDHWFGWSASRSRAQFCRQLGLPAENAMLLYACSSRFIADRERPAVMRWIRALRSSGDQRLATAGVVVRPHPLNGREWSDPSVANLSGVVVFPPGGADPVDEQSRADYFDSIVHADAVVGVNTSALVESAILDRPVFAFPEPDFHFSQGELPHFRLLAGEGGMLNVSASMAEHLAQLGQTLRNASADSGSRRRFVEIFIRPRGAAPSPTDRVVAAVEELLAVRAG
jgi:hypothetical protein